MFSFVGGSATIRCKILLFIKMPLLNWLNGRQANPPKTQILVGLSQSKYQSVDRAGIVALQNLHFTGSFLWPKETIWPLLHAGHMRLRIRSLRRIVDIKNGFKFLTPFICYVFSTHNMHHNSSIPNFQAAKDNMNSFAILRIQGSLHDTWISAFLTIPMIFCNKFQIGVKHKMLSQVLSMSAYDILRDCRKTLNMRIWCL